MSILDWFRGEKEEVAKAEDAPKPIARKSLFGTHAGDIESSNNIKDFVLDKFSALKSQQPAFDPKVTGMAMDDSSNGYPSFKMYDAGNNSVSDAVVYWYASQGFIGAQLCGILAQNWLVNKACAMPGDDAIRKGYNVVSIDGEELDPEAAKIIKAYDRSMRLTWNMREFIRKGRIFGVRVAMFKVQSTDPEYYEKPFNIDGVTANSYKGIVQVDPYWCAPMLDGAAASQPDTLHFYEPTWWIINGKKVHRSHLIIFRHAEPVDVLKPQYIYGGVPLTQQIMERVYASERVANEAPQLAMSKRTTVWLTDMEAAMSNTEQSIGRLNYWAQMRDNYGIKLGDKEGDEFQQFDTSLADFDQLIMTQYQLVAAIAGVPATKLIGTTPKGFNSTGEYEEASYHELLESIQTHDLTPLAERHHQLVIKSFVEPQLKKKVNVETTLNWLPLDTPTAEELATTNYSKAQTGAVLINSGVVSSEEERQRVATDKTSGYNEIGLEENEAPQAEEQAEEDYLSQQDAMDDKWITVHPHKGKGTPVLLGENGEVKAGMGGKFNGLHMKEVEKQTSENVGHGSLITKAMSSAKKDYKAEESERVEKHNAKYKRPGDKEVEVPFIDPTTTHKTNKADMFSSEASTGETTHEFKPNGNYHDETHQKSAEHYINNIHNELISKGYKAKELINGHAYEKNNHQVQVTHNLNDIDYGDEETPVQVKVVSHHKDNDNSNKESKEKSNKYSSKIDINKIFKDVPESKNYGLSSVSMINGELHTVSEYSLPKEITEKIENSIKSKKEQSEKLEKNQIKENSTETKNDAFLERMAIKAKERKAKKESEPAKEPIKRGENQSLLEKYKNISNLDLEKIIKENENKIAHWLKVGEGEMANGKRSTKKATANHAAWMLSNTTEEIKDILKQRQLTN